MGRHTSPSYPRHWPTDSKAHLHPTANPSTDDVIHVHTTSTTPYPQDTTRPLTTRTARTRVGSCHQPPARPRTELTLLAAQIRHRALPTAAKPCPTATAAAAETTTAVVAGTGTETAACRSPAPGRAGADVGRGRCVRVEDWLGSVSG